MSDWQRLADYLRSAMDRQRIRSQRDLADVPGVSPRTVGDLLRGVERKWSPRTMPAIERAVGWPPGSTRRILDGGEPDTGRTNPYTDPGEREIWNANHLSDTEKHELIAYRRIRQQVGGQDHREDRTG